LGCYNYLKFDCPKFRPLKWFDCQLIRPILNNIKVYYIQIMNKLKVLKLAF
jgi:hypothetical protein